MLCRESTWELRLTMKNTDVWKKISPRKEVLLKCGSERNLQTVKQGWAVALAVCSSATIISFDQSFVTLQNYLQGIFPTSIFRLLSTLETPMDRR
jgi:hypothetical protein